MRNRIIQIASIVMLLLITATEPSYAQPSEIWRETHDFSIGAPPNLYPARDVGLEIGTDAGGILDMIENTAMLIMLKNGATVVLAVSSFWSALPKFVITLGFVVVYIIVALAALDFQTVSSTS